MISRESLADVVGAYLLRQRWFAGEESSAAAVAVHLDVVEELLVPWPGMLRAEVVADADDGREGHRYQLFIGVRPIGEELRFLEGKEHAVLGPVESSAGAAMAYDALVDPELAVALLGVVAPDQPVERARALGVEQSNTSIIYDERLIMKVFRRLHRGANPDVELTRALAGVGFANISAPIGEWRSGDTDLAVVRTYLQGGVEGWQLALTSLRDLYDSGSAPEDCGGDFSPEARRLGELTAAMHVALAEALGSEPAEPAAWADEQAADLDRALSAIAATTDKAALDVLKGFDAQAVRTAVATVRTMRNPGRALRIHGDYHLGQTIRTDEGWFVLDFEGEPARPLSERSRLTSPLRDVAGMLRSLQYASCVALTERGVAEADPEHQALAEAWERYNGAALLDGYLGVEAVHHLLPASDDDRQALLRSFEIGKAVYEVSYELSHRPAWLWIPITALARLLDQDDA